MKLKYSKFWTYIIGVSFSILPYFYNNEKEATHISLAFICIILIFYKLFLKTDFLLEININTALVGIGLFIFAIVSQNIYLNYETIDWDVASYLVASQDISNGNIPNQDQWESKGPVLFYLYYFLLKFSGKNFVIFKLLNDLLIIGITACLYLTIFKISNKNKLKSIFGSLFFLVLMTQSWAVGEYSEIYSLFFIAASIYTMIKVSINQNKYLIIGILFALSTLINQGTILFAFPILHYLYLDKDFDNLKNRCKKFIFSVIFVHLAFILLYIFYSIGDVYIATYIQIPFGYVQSNYANLYELRVFLRSFYESYHPVYFALISTILFLIFQIYKNSKGFLNDWIFTYLLTSILFYYIGSHNYYHHLIFFLFAISLTIVKLSNLQSLLVSIFIFLASISVVLQDGNKSVNNLMSTELLFKNYPLRQLSEEIDSKFNRSYTVLALDHTLVLYYLDKPNYTYIVHPSNHAEDYIVSTLTKLGKIEENYLEDILLYQNPDVILCSARMIIKGDPTKNTLFNCAVDDYRKDYIKLDTTLYEQNPNLSYYFDPYREINVYIKNDVNN